MYKLLLVLLVVTFIAEAMSQNIILPTYRPPPRRPVIIRTVRSADRSEPQWLYSGDVPRAPASSDHPVLPRYIDSVKLDPNRRYARSLDSPSAKRGGGGHSTSSGSRDTGATHPGHNRRNARSIRYNIPPRPFPGTPPFNPFPRPSQPRNPFPILANN